jgi:hypothetical protein
MFSFKDVSREKSKKIRKQLRWCLAEPVVLSDVRWKRHITSQKANSVELWRSLSEAVRNAVFGKDRGIRICMDKNSATKNSLLLESTENFVELSFFWRVAILEPRQIYMPR